MTEKESLFIRVLQRIPLFEGLDNHALHALAAICNEKSFQKGQVIFEEESIGNSMMIIISGAIRISQISNTKNEEALCVLSSGDFFGDMGLLENRPRSASAIANADVYVLELEREKFLEFVKLDPTHGVVILLNLAKKLSARLREADAKIKTFVNLSQWI